MSRKTLHAGSVQHPSSRICLPRQFQALPSSRNLRAGHDHMTSPNPRCRFLDSVPCLSRCHTGQPACCVRSYRPRRVPSGCHRQWPLRRRWGGPPPASANRQGASHGRRPRSCAGNIGALGRHRGHEPERSATAWVLHGPCWYRFLSVSRHVVDAVPQGYEPQPAYITPSVPHHPAVPPQPDSHPDMTHTIAPSPRFFIYGDGID
jgi:hypothetical protein